ncbi:hypothetical protein DSO57_1031147 [Entomophthora muscae]|uniref:Uncharacterized protein n=1 Tax=Entomophthora muscae TaxID=34485 RepID=A0ACC2SPY8_9FUNG|nr:hypothetical protein DSO57_1031147 [Entomophthora muscae]
MLGFVWASIGLPLAILIIGWFQWRREAKRLEPLPWFVWEEIISFLDRRERWRLLTLDRIWRDKIVADSLQVVSFKTDPLQCRPRDELKRSQDVVTSINIFSSRNVDYSYFRRNHPKLKKLLLKNVSGNKYLIHCISLGEFSACFRRLTHLTFDGFLELTVLQRILRLTESLRDSGLIRSTWNHTQSSLNY